MPKSVICNAHYIHMYYIQNAMHILYIMNNMISSETVYNIYALETDLGNEEYTGELKDLGIHLL